MKRFFDGAQTDSALLWRHGFPKALQPGSAGFVVSAWSLQRGAESGRKILVCFLSLLQIGQVILASDSLTWNNSCCGEGHPAGCRSRRVAACGGVKNARMFENGGDDHEAGRGPWV